MVIAIDGPAGAGKSEISKCLAARLGFSYLDTGSLYRAIGLKALRSGISVDDEAALFAMLEHTELDVSCQVGGAPRVMLDGQDVSGLIRTQAISTAATHVSALGAVREWLLGRQREIASAGNVIMDGRDIGTKVLPDAEVKIFLTASPEIRAARRVKQLEEGGHAADYAEVLREVNDRDRRDTRRAISPLRRAEDAYLIDSSAMSIEQVVSTIIGRVERARSGR